jgi:GntR family transcriptional regulator
MVDKNSSVPLYLQIQNLIVDAIRTGEYQPGTQIPSELEISSRYEISRMTARKALDNLVTKGMLYRRRGKGTYVAENVVSYGLSTMLSFSRTLRARGYDVVTKLLQMDVIPASQEVMDNLQLNLNREVIVIRRLRLIEGAPAAIHTAFLEHRVFAPILSYDLSKESLLDAIQEISGAQVGYTKDTVQADLASVEEAKLLQVEPGSATLRVEGVAFTENGHPTRYSRAVFRGDMFKFVVNNNAEFANSLRISTKV